MDKEGNELKERNEKKERREIESGKGEDKEEDMEKYDKKRR